MARSPIKRIFSIVDCIGGARLLRDETWYGGLSRFRWSKADDDDEFKGNKGNVNLGKNSTIRDPVISGDSSGGEDNRKWKPDVTWVAKALEPALQLYKWALPAGNGIGNEPAPVDRSLSQIFASIRRSKLGIQDWSLSDLTIGLYLLYLRQASTKIVEDATGEVISSEPIIQDLMYHIELAKGAYKENAAGLARHSMLRENNILKFIRKSNVLRPGYYIGVDLRKKLVILGIRGTQSVYDLITDIITSGHEEITFEGYSAHFGTAEAARWFLTHEMDSIRRCLMDHKDFRLRIVGHSMGGATASLLAIMLRKKSSKELGFSPDIITAVGVATPPCVSKELAESCSDFVTTVVMQDDIIPRLSIASLRRLRKEIVETDWVTAFKNDEDWKRVVDLVSNAKHVVSSVQDVAQKLTEYAKFKEQRKYPEVPAKEELSAAAHVGAVPCQSGIISGNPQLENSLCTISDDDLFVPGMHYYLKRNADTTTHGNPSEYFTLLRRHPGGHSQRILLSSNIISDHKCDSHYYALRDVLKGLPTYYHETIFQ